jgi:hypothetical protein
MQAQSVARVCAGRFVDHGLQQKGFSLLDDVL